MRARKRDPDHPVTGEEVDARLSRRIRIWAQTWRRCPKKGCRRSRRCLRFDDCAGVSKQPTWPTAREKRRIWDPLRAAMRATGDRPPRYDPDERDRDRPLPPAPGE